MHFKQILDSLFHQNRSFGIHPIRMCSLCILFVVVTTSGAQDLSSYEKPMGKSMYSEALKDSVHLEIILPKGLEKNTTQEYPIIYVLDRQLRNNYKYNLYTIDYLSSFQKMPKAIIVGITFNSVSRIPWTLPNASGGKADDLIYFLESELKSELAKRYPISKFNLLIGHSRTAIFSSYALSKKHDFFNAAIASSVSNFDFGDALQKDVFESFLDTISTSEHTYYYYFSAGEGAYGDAHEFAADSLSLFLNSKELPKTLQWNYFKYKVAHDVTPGLTVNRALSNIFKEYGRRMYLCFKVAKESPQSVPWSKYTEIYESISKDLELNIQPSELFFNSIGSEYDFNYKNDYGKKHLAFASEILLKPIDTYPNEHIYYTWIGEIYMRLENFNQGDYYLNKSIQLIQNDKSISESERLVLLGEVNEYKRNGK